MTKKILIIEDDTFLQRLASKKLKETGYEVEVASNAEEAFKILEAGAPSMILLDLLLPGVDGFEVLARIRGNVKTKDIPVLVFSNLSEEKDIKKCVDLGIKGYVVKSSCTLNELIVKINLTLT